MKAQFVNEAMGFTQDGDPIHDMGIGNSFENLRVGTILRADENIRITSKTSLVTRDKGRITAWAGQYIVVLKQERTQLDKKKIKVWYQNAGDKFSDAQKIVTDLKSYKNNTALFNSMTGTPLQFEKRFTILQ
jgi:hypothetical protein